MKARHIQLGSRELLWLGGGLVGAAAVYLLLIGPAWAELAELPVVQARVEQVRQDLDQARGQLRGTQQRVEHARAELARLGGAPPAAGEKDLRIARLTTLAARCGLQVDNYTPAGVVQHADHQASVVEFASQGDWADIRRFLNAVEGQMDFADVTHFELSRGDGAAGDRHRLRWFCRLNSLSPAGADTGGEAPTVGPLARGPSLREGPP